MEELKSLARTYYQNVINIKYFGWYGSACVVCALIIAVVTSYYHFKYNLSDAIIIPMLCAALFGAGARSQYNKNLIIHLSEITLLDSDNVEHHKAVYLQLLVSHVADSLYEAMESFKGIREVYVGEYNLFSQSEWSRFLKFIYDPDSKNRILSLLIYSISLVALITINKPDSSNAFFELVHALDFKTVGNYLIIVVVSILMCYMVFFMPVRFLYKYLVVPLMLQISSVDMLSKFFIFELNKYAYFESRVNRGS